MAEGQILEKEVEETTNAKTGLEWSDIVQQLQTELRAQSPAALTTPAFAAGWAGEPFNTQVETFNAQRHHTLASLISTLEAILEEKVAEKELMETLQALNMAGNQMAYRLESIHGEMQRLIMDMRTSRLTEGLHL